MRYQRDEIIAALLNIDNIPQRERERRRVNRAFPSGRKVTTGDVNIAHDIMRASGQDLKVQAKGHLRKVLPATLVPKGTKSGAESKPKSTAGTKPKSTEPTVAGPPKEPTAYQAAILADPKKYGVGFGRGKNHTPDQYRARKELWATLAH